MYYEVKHHRQVRGQMRRHHGMTAYPVTIFGNTKGDESMRIETLRGLPSKCLGQSSIFLFST